MQLSELVSKYIGDPRYLSTDRSKDTYEHCLRQFLAYLTNVGVDNSIRSLTPENVEGFVQYLYANGLSNTSVNLRLSAIAGLAKYGKQQRSRGKPLVASNPVEFVKRPKNERPKEKYLALDEIRSLLAADGPANERLAIALIADQPLRATEYCEAKVSDLSLSADGTVSLTVRVKGGRFKTKVLGAKVSEALQASLREREAGSDETLLVNTAGQAYTRQTLSEMIVRTARRVGVTRLPVRAHVIRHSIASLAAANGATEHELAEMLNHAGTATVRRYVHGIRPDAALTKVRAMLNE